MLDLTTVAPEFIRKHGLATAIQVTGVSESAARLWADGKPPRLEHVQKLLECDPDPIHAIKPFYLDTPIAPGKLVCYVITNRPIPWQHEAALTELKDRNQFKVIYKQTNFLVRGRNQVAYAFLKSAYEWSVWSDDDVVPPFGDAALFKDICKAPYYPSSYAGINSIARMLSHRKTMVSSCYFGRAPDSHAMFSEAFAEGAYTIDAALHNAGPRNEIHPSNWCGFGWVLIHRSVFEDIIKACPDIELTPERSQIVKYTHGFFDPFESGDGEDVPFCKRAKIAGHQIFIDLAVFPGHVGPCAFTFFNTRPQPKVP